MKSPTRTTPNQKSLSIDRSVVILAAIILAGMLTLFVVQLRSAGSQGPRTDQPNRLRIEKMSAEERSTVERDAKLFAKLTPEKQESLRELHRHLTTGHDAASLQQTLERYNAWVSELPTFLIDELRERLRKAPDAVAKRMVVESVKSKHAELKRKHDLEKWIRTLPHRQQIALYLEKNLRKRQALINQFHEDQELRIAGGESASSGLGRHGRGYGLRLNSDQLDTVLVWMASGLNLTDQQRARLKSLKPVERHYEILLAVLRIHLQQEKEGKAGLLRDSSLAANLNKRSGTLGSVLRERLLSQLQRKHSLSPSHRKWRYHILAPLIYAFWMERRPKPSDTQLSAIFHQLDGRERDEVLNRRGNDLKRRLMFLYYKKQRGKDGSKFKELYGLLRRLFRPSGGPPGRGRFRPGREKKPRGKRGPNDGGRPANRSPRNPE